MSTGGSENPNPYPEKNGEELRNRLYEDSW